MSKFAMIVALMLVTAFDAYCLYMYPVTDAHFTYAAYTSCAVALLIVYVEFFHLIVNGVKSLTESRRQAKAAKALRKNTVVQEPALPSETINNGVPIR